MENTAAFLLEFLAVWSVSEIKISSEQFVGTFSSKHHFHVLRGHPRQEKVWDGGSDELGFIGLQMVYDLFDVLEGLICLKGVLVVDCAQVFGH